jgi:hypothetical protein
VVVELFRQRAAKSLKWERDLSGLLGRFIYIISPRRAVS